MSYRHNFLVFFLIYLFFFFFLGGGGGVNGVKSPYRTVSISVDIKYPPRMNEKGENQNLLSLAFLGKRAYLRIRERI